MFSAHYLSAKRLRAAAYTIVLGVGLVLLLGACSRSAGPDSLPPNGQVIDEGPNAAPDEPATEPSEDPGSDTDPDAPDDDSGAGTEPPACTPGQVADAVVLEVQGHCLAVPFVSSEVGAQPTRIVIGVHGVSRNHESMQRSLERALPASLASRTLIVSPKFRSDGDDAWSVSAAGSSASAVTTPQWPGNDWTEGDESVPFGSSTTVSSYQVMDALVLWLAEKYGTPGQLTNIVVYGHSAGGQFVNRYAAGTSVPHYVAPLGVRVSFVLANPSSYLYFDARRPLPGDLTEFAEVNAAQAEACPSYDRYKYGLVRRNPYMATVAANLIVDRYFARSVVHLVGELDDDPDGEHLATDCAAELQGSTRLERALAYHNYRYTVAAPAHHVTAVLPGTGHESSEVTTSACGLYYLFGAGSASECVAVPPAVVEPEVAIESIR